MNAWPSSVLSSPPMPTSESVAGMLETLASERPDLLPLYLDMAANSPVRHAIIDLASLFGSRIEDLGQALLKVSQDLDCLEKKRWKDPREVLSQPQPGALMCLCRARRARVTGVGRRRRLDAVERKLSRAQETESTRRWISAFIGDQH